MRKSWGLRRQAAAGSRSAMSLMTSAIWFSSALSGFPPPHEKVQVAEQAGEQVA
jgi:hypothetical protein